MISKKMTKQKKLQIFIVISALFVVASIVNAQTCPGIQYATGGCGGVGAKGIGPPEPLIAVSCRQCACWCGWEECCYKPTGETSKAAGRADWLFNFSMKQCGCSSPGLSASEVLNKPRTTPPTKEEVQSIVARSLGQFQYQKGGNAFIVGPDGIGLTNCSGMVSYWWHQLGLPDLGNVGIGFSKSDVAAYLDSSITMDQLNPGDLILLDFPGAASHVGMYIGDGLVAHMANASNDLVIDDLQTFWSYGTVPGVIRVPGY